MEASICLDLALQAHDSPAICRMTLVTANTFKLLMERACMRRHMTGRTAFLRQIRECIAAQFELFAQNLVHTFAFEGLGSRGRSMAFEALIFFMLASQIVDRIPIVIKTQRVFPLHFVMTAFALKESTLLIADFLAIAMVVLVASEAVFLQSCPIITTLAFAQGPCRLFMTIFALDFVVRAAQGKAGNRMVKGLLSL